MNKVEQIIKAVAKREPDERRRIMSQLIQELIDDNVINTDPEIHDGLPYYRSSGEVVGLDPD